MIKPQQFVVLGAVTIVALVAAAMLHASSTQRAPGTVEGRPLLPELRRQANALSGIELHKSGKTLTLVRKGEQWSIKERAGYPVESDKVRALLVQLTNAELAEPKTASKDRWPLLDLEDPAAAESKSSLVRLLDAGGKPIAELVIGKQRMNAFGTGRHGIYVRRPNETQTWLASGEPKLALEVKDWVDPAIFKADTEKLSRVTVAHAKEVPIVVEREGEVGKGGKFVLKTVPEGMKVKQTAGVEHIALSLGSVEFEDVRKLDATPVGDNVSTITAESSDGLTVTFHLRREGNENEPWLSFTAAGAGEAKKAADAINAKATGWEFKIPKWKADQIGKRAVDIFETISDGAKPQQGAAGQ
jgi:hypothetical protein